MRAPTRASCSWCRSGKPRERLAQTCCCPGGGTGARGRERRAQLRYPPLQVLAAVRAAMGRTVSEEERQHDCEDHQIDETRLGHLSPPSMPLEANVLKSFGRVAIQPGGRPVVAATCGEISTCDPRGSAEARV